MHCPSCGIEILTQNGFCPLCGIYIQHTEEQTSADSDEIKQRTTACRYPLYKEKKPDTVKTSIFFTTCVVSILSLFINYLTFAQNHFLWSLIVISSVFFIYKTVFIWTSRVYYIGSKLFIQFFWSAQLMIVIDLLTGLSFWSFSLVIPWFSVGITTTLTILAVCNHKNYQEYTGYMTAAFFLSLVLFCMSLFPFIKVKWPSWAAMLYAILTLFGLFLFSRKQFKAELKKRFLL
ncbi:MAG: DUF6320 domain-containing protein [Treponema sp.]|nr:DUF6320 domain-containing protein [Treponema sp.]